METFEHVILRDPPAQPDCTVYCQTVKRKFVFNLICHHAISLRSIAGPTAYALHSIRVRHNYGCRLLIGEAYRGNLDYYPQDPSYALPVYDPPLGFPRSGSRLDYEQNSRGASQPGGGGGQYGQGGGLDSSQGNSGDSQGAASDAEKLDDALEMNEKLEEELKTVLAERDAEREAKEAAEADRDDALEAKKTAEKLAADLQSEVDMLGDELDGLRRRVKRSVSIFLPGDKIPADVVESAVTEPKADDQQEE